MSGSVTGPVDRGVMAIRSISGPVGAGSWALGVGGVCITCRVARWRIEGHGLRAWQAWWHHFPARLMVME